MELTEEEFLRKIIIDLIHPDGLNKATVKKATGHELLDALCNSGSPLYDEVYPDDNCIDEDLDCRPLHFALKHIASVLFPKKDSVLRIMTPDEAKVKTRELPIPALEALAVGTVIDYDSNLGSVTAAQKIAALERPSLPASEDILENIDTSYGAIDYETHADIAKKTLSLLKEVSNFTLGREVATDFMKFAQTYLPLVDATTAPIGETVSTNADTDKNVNKSKTPNKLPDAYAKFKFR